MNPKILIITIILLLLFVSGERTSANYRMNQTSTQQETTVIICTGKYSKRYHNHICRGMKACKGEVKKVKLSEAKKMGLTPCGYCYK